MKVKTPFEPRDSIVAGWFCLLCFYFLSRLTFPAFLQFLSLLYEIVHFIN